MTAPTPVTLYVFFLVARIVRQETVFSGLLTLRRDSGRRKGGRRTIAVGVTRLFRTPTLDVHGLFEVVRNYRLCAGKAKIAKSRSDGIPARGATTSWNRG